MSRAPHRRRPLERRCNAADPSRCSMAPSAHAAISRTRGSRSRPSTDARAVPPRATRDARAPTRRRAGRMPHRPVKHAQQRRHRARRFESVRRPTRRPRVRAATDPGTVPRARRQRAAVLDPPERPRGVGAHIHDIVAQLAHEGIHRLRGLGEPETDRRDSTQRRIARRQLRDERRRDALVVLHARRSHAQLPHTGIVRRECVERPGEVGVGDVLQPPAIAALRPRRRAERRRRDVGAPPPAVAERLRGEAADDRRRTARSRQQRGDVDRGRDGLRRMRIVRHAYHGQRAGLAVRVENSATVDSTPRTRSMITPVFAPISLGLRVKNQHFKVSTGAHDVMRAQCDQRSGIRTGLRPGMRPRTGGVAAGQCVDRHLLHARIR